MSAVLVRHGDRVWSIELLPDGRVRLDGLDEPMMVENIEAGAYRVRRPDGGTIVYAAADRNLRWIFVDGCVFELDVDREDRQEPRPRSHHDALSAPMPATVVRILVAPGDDVAAGDTVLLLEAMKMELPVRAPHHAVVTAVHCREGELVQPGVPLIDLDELPAA